MASTGIAGIFNDDNVHQRHQPTPAGIKCIARVSGFQRFQRQELPPTSTAVLEIVGLKLCQRHQPVSISAISRGIGVKVGHLRKQRQEASSVASQAASTVSTVLATLKSHRPLTMSAGITGVDGCDTGHQRHQPAGAGLNSY